MNTLFQIDWKSLFIPSLSIAEVLLRGTVIYLFIFVLLRILRREAGAIGIPDILLVVLIADAAQNAMADDYKSITEGVLLIGTIAFWDFFLDWLSYRFPKTQRLFHPPPLLLIKDGQLQWRNMRREMITEKELMGQLREQGIEKLEEVKESFIEGNGHISVIKKDSTDN